VAVAVLFWLWPTPAGLKAEAWHYFGLFAGVIAALVLESMPAGAVGIIGLTVAALSGFVEKDPNKALRWMLSGFAESMVWQRLHRPRTVLATRAVLRPRLLRGARGRGVSVAAGAAALTPKANRNDRQALLACLTT
jgi:hypothetical protein